MPEGSNMDFELSQAKFRGALAALTIVSTIMLPVMGWQVIRYIDNLTDLGDSINDLSIKVAMMSVQITNLQEDVDSLETYMKEPQVRQGYYILPKHPSSHPAPKKM